MLNTIAKRVLVLTTLFFVVISVLGEESCETPPATVVANAVYNGGVSPWNAIFSNNHRSATLSTTSTSEPYYQWILCNADGSLITENPTVADNHVQFTTSSIANNTTVLFDLPGTYYFVLRAGCSRAVYTASNIVRIDVPYPEMSISGNLFSGTYRCLDLTSNGVMNRNGLTWSINFNVKYPGSWPDWNKDFAIFQRYKRGNVGLCGGIAGTEGWNTWDDDGKANKLGYESVLDMFNVTHDLGTIKEAIEDLSDGDNVTLTVTMTGYDSYRVVLLKNCTPPAAVEASILYNGGTEPWVGTFADEHRSAVLSTSATQYPYYQWVLCDEDGTEITHTPTDAAHNVHFTGESDSYNAKVQFNLPGSYNFRVKVGCDASNTTLSPIVNIDVPAPVFGVAGPLFYGTWGCQAPTEGLLERETPTGLRWSKEFTVTGLNTEAWSNDFTVFQRYKRGDTGLCEGIPGTEGWNKHDDYNTANKTAYSAGGEELVNCKKKTRNDGNYMQDITGLKNGSKVKVIVDMTAADSYRVELQVICITPDEPEVTYVEIK